VIKIITDTAHCGFGEAPQTAVITGDTNASVIAAVKEFIRPALCGMAIDNPEGIMQKLHGCIANNTGAKASVDMAVYDLLAKKYGAPLYKILGGFRNEIKTDLTVSVNTAEEMVRDSMAAVRSGYDILKIKAGKSPEKDIENIRAIRKAVGKDIRLRIDANQGWQPKQAVRIIRRLEDMALNIELVEQPVYAGDLAGMKFVTRNVLTPILADESVFSAKDALKIIRERAADMINIKLMKTGGIYNALKILSLAETYQVECMMGSMLEGHVSAGAAAHLACAKGIITKADIDGPALCGSAPLPGGPELMRPVIKMSEAPGIGFEGFADVVTWV
jgi:o-succinylbenzoate synthase